MTVTYKKNIERTHTGMLIAHVYRYNENNERHTVGLNFFGNFWFESEERSFKRAHKWADNIISVCQEHEVIV